MSFPRKHWSLPAQFPCTSCGLCCQHIGDIPALAAYDLKNGCCQHYSQFEGCQIYENRPDVCRIDKGYDLFFANILSREKYYQYNAEICNHLQLLHGINEKFRVVL